MCLAAIFVVFIIPLDDMQSAFVHAWGKRAVFRSDGYDISNDDRLRCDISIHETSNRYIRIYISNYKLTRLGWSVGVTRPVANPSSLVFKSFFFFHVLRSCPVATYE